jgi:hypothetical protein
MAQGSFDNNLDTVWETVRTLLPDLEVKLRKMRYPIRSSDPPPQLTSVRTFHTVRKILTKGELYDHKQVD